MLLSPCVEDKEDADGGKVEADVEAVSNDDGGGGGIGCGKYSPALSCTDKALPINLRPFREANALAELVVLSYETNPNPLFNCRPLVVRGTRIPTT